MEEKIEFYKEIEFKDTEIGKIPKEWEVVKLDEVSIKIKAGGTPLTSKKEYYNGNIPFVKIEDMTRSYKYLRSTSTTITEAGLKNSNAWLVPVNSLLVAIYASIGVIAINKIEVTTNQAILSILPIEEKTNVEFLFYTLTYLKPLLKKYTKETTQKNLTGEIMKNFKVALPSLSEQQKITSILSTVDESIQKTDDIIANTERLKKGLMEELLTKGIGHKEFKDTEIGKIPKEWEVVKLKDVLLLLRNGITLRQIKEGNGYPVTRIETISEEKIDPSKLGHVVGLHEKDIEEYRLIEGDILFSHINSLEHIGKTAIYEGEPGFILHGMNLLLLRPDKNKVDTKFLLYLLRLFRARKLFGIMAKKAVNQASINQTELGNLKIFLPSLSEQQKIASILSNVYEKLENLRRERTKLEKIKQWFMEELLSGRIRVRVA